MWSLFGLFSPIICYFFRLTTTVAFLVLVQILWACDMILFIDTVFPETI